MVALQDYPQPIMAEDKVPPAEATCLGCHNPQRFLGDKLLVKTSYSDDEKNSMTRTVVLLHIGGRDASGNLSGIHGAHMGHIEYLATDSTHQTIPWVSITKGDGSATEYLSTDQKTMPAGQKHVMDCIDCHNRAAHSFDTAEEALNKHIAAGSPAASLPFIHKEGLALIKAAYSSQEDANAKITAALGSFYQPNIQPSGPHSEQTSIRLQRALPPSTAGTSSPS